MSDDQPWQQRLVDATHGASTQTGAIALAMLHVWPRTCPAYGDEGVITSSGMVLAAFKDREGDYAPLVPVGMIGDIVDDFRRVADHLKLNDADRVAMFVELQKWISVDMRAVGKAPLS